MKSKKIKKMIQGPLRFHHQDIHEELEELKGMIRDVSNQMQELREAIRGSSQQDEELSVRESYEHPWYKYKRQELISGGNYQQSEGKETSVS